MMRAQERSLTPRSVARMAISFRPMGEARAWWVVTAWLEDGFVRWSSPCLDESHEHADMRAFERRFGDCACTLPAFMRAMNWLDAVCFGAADLESVQRACETNPEYGLICEDATRLEEALLRPERSHDL